MLARTADNLYWLARNIERIDYLARVLEAAQRLSALPADYGGGDMSSWEGALASAGARELYDTQYSDITAANVVSFLAFDHSNPSSISNCIEVARMNARAVRTALTAEAWDSINAGWLELKRIERARDDQVADGEAFQRFLEFARKLSLDFDGSANRTMLRNDGFWFLRLGLFLERADNTARLLDVKYHLLLPQAESEGALMDYFQWTAILRAVSALTAYHWVYREGIKPDRIADLLICNRQMPRSLLSCYDNIVSCLEEIARTYGRQGVSQRQARMTHSRLENTALKDVFNEGLHNYLETFLVDNNRLGGVIAEQYLVI